jgi:hypothetical protein
MLPTEAKVKECFDLSRAFFKGGAKSHNKTYVSSAKAAGEHDRIFGSGVLLQLPRTEAVDFVTKGQLMRETGNTFGNCHEATSIAASYVAEKMPGVPTIAASCVGADHVLLIVGDVPSSDLMIRQWSGMQGCRGRSHAIDVWAGICCPTNEYPALFAAKLQQWQQQGKRIVVKVDSDARELTTDMPVSWGGNVLDARVRHINVRSEPNINPDMDRAVKRSLLQKMEQSREDRISQVTHEQRAALETLQEARRELASVEAQIEKFVLDAKAGANQHPSGLSQELQADFEQATSEVKDATADLRLLDKELFYLQMQESRRQPPGPASQSVLQQSPGVSVMSGAQSGPQPPQRSDRPSVQKLATDGAHINRSKSPVRR